MIDKPTIAIAAGSGTTMSVTAAKSVQNTQSMLNSSWDQIIDGAFTLYGSDLAFFVGSALTLAGIVVSLLRWLFPKGVISA
ncbi:hypothetical protein [Enterovibrio sp. 27052020O]|uniref:hypothetical protein n=1 Tax=Enterovibrio sp. 27052020O TaxID=3241166 RepID=UPI0038900F71